MATKIVSGRKIRPFVWVPPTNEIEYKIEIVTNSETYDVTENIVEGEYTDGITETIGNFTFTIDNTGQDYTNKFNLYDRIRIYMDYATSATTKVFEGRIEKVNTKEGDIVISGRSVASRVMGITVTYRAADYTHEILSTILTKYAGYITKTNIDTTESTDAPISVNWYHKPFWECVQELCNRSGYDAYIDANSDFNYFVSESKENTTEAVVHTHNLEEVGDFTPDLSVVYNRIIVYGAKVEEMQIIWMEQDTDSIASYDVRELTINDSNIITVAQARARALYELSLHKDPPIIGEVTSLGLPTILPGERIRISDPDSELDPKYYNIQKFTHRFSSDDVPLTVLTIQKEMSTIPKILKKRISFEIESTEKENPNEMRFSIIETFDSDIGTHSTTEITEGRLKTTTGNSTGTWISNLITTSNNVTSYELRVKGEALPGTIYSISTDGGSTYQSINALNMAYSASPPGTNIKIKIVFASASTQIDAYSLLYKT